MSDMKIKIPMPLANGMLSGIIEKMIFGKTGIRTDIYLKELCISTNEGKINAHVNADILLDARDLERVIKNFK